MDKIEAFISQPGYTKAEITKFTKMSCVEDPITQWGVGADNLLIPEGYKICLSSTLLTESDSSSLIGNMPSSSGGIYLLYAVPYKISRSTRPVRRIFCRPKPYCYKKTNPESL